MAGAHPQPGLSFLLVAEKAESLAAVLAHLERQTIADRVELVIVTSDPGSFALDPARPEPFASVRLIGVASVLPLGAARAEAVRVATSPIVFLGETHTFAASGLAEALLAAHEGAWAGIAPAIDNANPGTARSWAAFLPDYGAWFAPASAREIETVPSYNATFRRDLLVALGDRLPDLLEPTSELRDELRAAGHRFAIEPRATLQHLNVERLGAWACERYLHGRLIGGHRAERWSAWRRIVYACGAPMLPVVLSLRLRRDLRGRAVELPRFTWPALLAGFALSTVGELVGYCLGRGSAPRRMAAYELDKWAFVISPVRGL